MIPEDTQGAVAEVAPAMAACSERLIEKDLWSRPELSRRDRSLVTVAALISRNDTAELPHHLNVALECGITPTEISETLSCKPLPIPIKKPSLRLSCAGTYSAA